MPAWCTFDCRIALYPGMSAADGAKEIEDCLQTAARNDGFLANNPPEVVYNGFYAEGYTLEEGTEAEALLARTHAAVYGHDLKSFVTPAYLDGRVFVLYQDTPCLVYGPISKHIHGFDERVSLSSTKKVTQSIALFHRRLVRPGGRGLTIAPGAHPSIHGASRRTRDEGAAKTKTAS